MEKKRGGSERKNTYLYLSLLGAMSLVLAVKEKNKNIYKFETHTPVISNNDVRRGTHGCFEGVTYRTVSIMMSLYHIGCRHMVPEYQKPQHPAPPSIFLASDKELSAHRIIISSLHKRFCVPPVCCFLSLCLNTVLN